ncbi:MAG: efflux RND transporter periplasmic adaptor subunit [Bacteroidales bacterium]|nr:efflux RND transporter periplasmic adaptor subunit [Bacteroidales bacterium]
MERRKKSYNLVIGIIALIVIVLAVSFAGYIVSKPKPILIQGEAEATEYRVSGKVPGRVEQFMASEGQMVHKGDTLVEIDSPEVKAKLAQAMAVKNMAEAQKNKALTGARKEQIAAAYELWQQAKVQEDIMKKSYERMKRLYEQKVVAAQKFDEVEAKYKAAQSTCKAAESQYSMAVNGARKEDKESAIALVDQANAALMEVNSYLGELFLTSPADGVVSARYPKVGELVGQGAPIMTITDLDDVWFTFNIREDMLKGMKTGDKITVTVPALNDIRCDLKVNYISVRESYATWRATKEYGQYDARTFEVRAVPVKKIDGIRPGMSAIVVNE